MSNSWKRTHRYRGARRSGVARGQAELLEPRWCPASAPQLLADINSVALPSALSDPKDLLTIDNKLYFVAASDTDLSPAVWESDGTDTGTRVFHRPGIVSRTFTAGGKLLYFGDGNRPYVIDGQSSTLLVENNDNNGVLPQHVHSWTERAIGLFTYDSGSMTGLWRTDGTKGGTVQLLNGQVATPFYWGDRALVSRINLTSTQLETWITDGTQEGTVRLASWEFPPSTSTSSESVVYHSFGSQIYFSFRDSIHGTELWRTDGTVAGTRLVWDVAAGKNSSDPGAFATLAHRMYFFANVFGGRQLHSTDGTAAGTRQERWLDNTGLGISVRQTMTVAGRLLIVGRPGDIGPNMLWVSDGTFAGTTVQSLDDVGRWTDETTRNDYWILGVVGDRVLLARSQGRKIQDRYDLWSWDVATGSVTKVVAPQLSSLSVLPGDLTELVNGRLAMRISTPESQLFVISDGTAEGTQVLDRFQRLQLDQAVRHGGRLSFPAQRDESSNLTLWWWDGSTTKPQLLKNVIAPTSSSVPGTFVSMGNATYFLAQPRQSFARRLYRTDGTATGTVAISNPIPSPPGRSDTLIAGDSLLYFSVDRDLWRSDGTMAGTFRVAATGLSRPHILGDRLYFYGSDSLAHGAELWTSDGTVAGTHMVRDLALGPNSADIVPLGNWQQLLVFSFDLGAGSRSLWVTDGTSAGTRRIFDFPGGQPEAIVTMPQQMLFASGRTLRRLNPVTRQWQNVPLPAEFTQTAWVEPVAGGAVIADTPYEDGVQLWRIWRVEETSGLAKIAEGTEESRGGISSLRAVDASTQQVIFFSNWERTLWRTDGTVNGTRIIGQFTPARFPNLYQRYLIANSGKVYGVAHQTFWQVDERGLTAIDSPVDLATTFAGEEMVLRSSQLYFKAVDPLLGIEPYVWTVPLGDPPAALPGTLTETPQPNATFAHAPASDGNGDGRVDSLDLAQLVAAWTGAASTGAVQSAGTSTAARTSFDDTANHAWADLDSDGDVDTADLLILLAAWAAKLSIDGLEPT